MAEPPVTIEPLTPELVDDFLDFFDNRAFADNPAWGGCYCYFPLHDPDEEPWEGRSAQDNRRAMTEAIADWGTGGFLAYAQGRVVGWCHAGPRDRFPMLRRLPGDGSRIAATPCFVVESSWRGRGVAAALLDAAVDAARAEGMAMMEAAPREDGAEPTDHFRGPLSMYLAAGYQRVAELPGGGVLVQKDLGGPGER